MQIRCIFDVTNLQQYRAGFAPMLFQWSHGHIAHFFIAKNRAIKRGLEQKNRAIKKSCYVCHGTKTSFDRRSTSRKRNKGWIGAQISPQTSI